MGPESAAAYGQAQDCALADAVEYGSLWQATPDPLRAWRASPPESP
ncbi:hypothetical protein [Streptomyces cyaneochromogenes]|nr:hypothetical protein [Streptomyces cyaneochromogenes]